MKIFLRHTMLFCLPVVIIGVAFELLLQHIPNDYSYKKKYLDENSKNIEVLFLGTSHILNGINPEYMSVNSFNASHVSQSLKYDYKILKKYEARWKKLKYIVIPVDYFSLYNSIEDTPEAWRVKNYTNYYEFGSFSDCFKSAEIFNNKVEYNFNRVTQYYFNGISDITCNRFGWEGHKGGTDTVNLMEAGKTAAERHTAKNYPEIDIEKCYGENYSFLKQIINFATNNGCRIILVTCPVYRTYIANADSVQLGKTHRSVMQLLAMDKNIIYKNYFADSSFSAKDFFDADHLNIDGAIRFTKILDDEIKRIPKL